MAITGPAIVTAPDSDPSPDQWLQTLTLFRPLFVTVKATKAKKIVEFKTAKKASDHHGVLGGTIRNVSRYRPIRPTKGRNGRIEAADNCKSSVAIASGSSSITV